MMQATIDVTVPTSLTVSQVDAQRTAIDYVAAHINSAFEVVAGGRYYHKPLGQEIWQFIIRCEHGPLDAIHVNVQSGAIISLTNEQICAIREKAAVLAARKRGVLPVDAQGYVLGEYARRRANAYLSMEVSLFYSAVEGIFVPLAQPIWQFSIEVQLPRLGILGRMGTIDVDAQNGEAIPLTHKQIKRIRERADALVELRTQTAAA
jgi:hypothetical protein